MPVQIRDEGLDLRIKVTPRASRDELGGTVRDAAGAAWLAVKVTAPPDAGKANAAVVRLLAKALGLAPSDLEITSGHASRWKRVRVSGRPEALEERIASLIEKAH